MGEIISVRKLRKTYRDLVAVDDIDLDVPEGRTFAFLGPNGAGKSTTLDMLCTLTKPDSGEVTLNGHVLGRDDDAIRDEIGVVFQGGYLDETLSVRENLEVRAGFYGLTGDAGRKAAARCIESTECGEFADRRYGKLSGGQRRRADIARSLLNEPRILFLDEPTTGLDPAVKERIWENIRSIQKEYGTTVFLTTHYMEEAATADMISIIDRGRIVAGGTPHELKRAHSRDVLKIRPSDRGAVLGAMDGLGFEYEEAGDFIIARLESTIAAIPAIELMKGCMDDFEVIHGSMDDVFLNITGRNLRD